MRKTVVCHVRFSIVHIFLRFPFHRVIWTHLRLLYGDGAAFLTCRLVNLWDYCKIFSPIRKEEFRRRLGHLGILETKHTESWLSQTHLSVIINQKIFCYFCKTVSTQNTLFWVKISKKCDLVEAPYVLIYNG